jgi:hypothetical protein
MVIKEESKKRAGIGHSLVSAPPLQHQTHRELVYRFFQFNKRSQYFVGTHDETQPQLHPALLRLSAMISQYFTKPNFIRCP